MATLPVTCEAVDMATGETVETKTAPFNILPPAPDACQICGRRPNHDPAQPHDAQSLYYQYAFFAEHGRWPTWKDAVVHCADDVKALWEQHLRAAGAWPADPTPPHSPTSASEDPHGTE